MTNRADTRRVPDAFQTRSSECWHGLCSAADLVGFSPANPAGHLSIPILLYTQGITRAWLRGLPTIGSQRPRRQPALVAVEMLILSTAFKVVFSRQVNLSSFGVPSF